MRIDVRTRAVEGDAAARVHAERRLRFAVGRFGPAVAGVRVRVLDVNGPRGGVDKVCRMRAELPRGGSVRVEQAAETAVAAIDQAADRLGRAVARELARRRDLPRAGRREMGR